MITGQQEFHLSAEKADMSGGMSGRRNYFNFPVPEFADVFITQKIRGIKIGNDAANVFIFFNNQTDLFLGHALARIVDSQLFNGWTGLAKMPVLFKSRLGKMNLCSRPFLQDSRHAAVIRVHVGQIDVLNIFDAETDAG